MTAEAADRLYERFLAAGVEHGPAFRGLRRLWRDGDTAVGLIESDAAPHGSRNVHARSAGLRRVPAHRRGLRRRRRFALASRGSRPAPCPRRAASTRVWCRAHWLGHQDSGDRAMNMEIFSDDGEPLAVVEGLRLRAVPSAALAEVTGARPRRYEVTWQPFLAHETSENGARMSGTWLVYGPDHRQVEEWHAQLTEAGATVIALLDDSSPAAGDLGERLFRKRRDADPAGRRRYGGRAGVPRPAGHGNRGHRPGPGRRNGPGDRERPACRAGRRAARRCLRGRSLPRRGVPVGTSRVLGAEALPPRLRGRAAADRHLLIGRERAARPGRPAGSRPGRLDRRRQGDHRGVPGPQVRPGRRGARRADARPADRTAQSRGASRLGAPRRPR